MPNIWIRNVTAIARVGPMAAMRWKYTCEPAGTEEILRGETQITPAARSRASSL
jgi:hypothetical protein